MTKNILSNELHGWIVFYAALTVLVWPCLDTKAQERTIPPDGVNAVAYATVADLEKAFWLCDYAGTTRSVDSGMAMACSAITEELKIWKFDGDFDALVAWWRQNKPAQHEALEAESRSKAGMRKAAPAEL